MPFELRHSSAVYVVVTPAGCSTEHYFGDFGVAGFSGLM